MIDTSTLMLGKGLLTAGAALGFCFWQLAVLKRERRREEAIRRADRRSAENRALERERERAGAP